MSTPIDPSHDAGMFEAELLYRMHLIRAFEVEVQKLFGQGLVRATTHLCNGQEAVPVGACAAIRRGDTMLCTYRGHGAVLAMGTPPDAALAEILGRRTGLCRGKGGSMHLTDAGRGVMGSHAIVGAHLPIAVGLALAAKHSHSDAVSLCFFGDGTTNIGAFHEALNLSAVWQLPNVFICENNQYGEYSPWRSTTRVERLVDRAHAYGMPGVEVDGNDVLAVHAVVAEATRRARAGGGPTLIEAQTYRFVGHSRSDPGDYRPPGELERWRARDPLSISAMRLRARGVADQVIERCAQAAQETIAAASAAARAAAHPVGADGEEHVYA